VSSPGEGDGATQARPPAVHFSVELIETCSRLRPRIARIARALLRHAADADDATQASLLEILKCAGTHRGDGSFDAWADRIAVRTTLRLARQRRVRSLRIDEAEPDSLAIDPPDASLREGLPRDVAEYLAELPETRRTALVLRHALGYSIDEIAEVTGVSPNTVKDRLLAAREQVRKCVRREVANGAPGRFPGRTPGRGSGA
jgi:RNA polymerase sigma-70 factor (ECF subfamily)